MGTLSLQKGKGERQTHYHVTKTAIEYYNQHRSITKEVGEKIGEKTAYRYIGNTFECLGDVIKAIEYYSIYLKIAKEV